MSVVAFGICGHPGEVDLPGAKKKSFITLVSPGEKKKKKKEKLTVAVLLA